MIRVMVVDDDALVRMGLVDLLETDPDLEVVAQAADGQQALDAASTRRVDVALVDVRMPVMNGIAATARLRALPHPPRVVVLTTFDVDEYVYRALAAGADGFLLKDTEPREILRAVHVVAAGFGDPPPLGRPHRHRPLPHRRWPGGARGASSRVVGDDERGGRRRARHARGDGQGARQPDPRGAPRDQPVQAALVARDAGLGDP